MSCESKLNIYNKVYKCTYQMSLNSYSLGARVQMWTSSCLLSRIFLDSVPKVDTGKCTYMDIEKNREKCV